MAKSSTPSGNNNLKNYSVHLPENVLNKKQDELRLKKLKDLLAKAKSASGQKS